MTRINVVPVEKLTEGIDNHWFGQYHPTIEAQTINRQRIAERLWSIKP